MELGLHHRPTKTEQEAIEAMRAFREKIRIAAHDLERRKKAELDRKTEILLQKAVEKAEKEAFTQDVGNTAILIEGDIRRIQNLVCDRMMISRIELLSARRFHRAVVARQIAMYLCKTYTLRSLPEIGRRFGGRDHSTILHSCRKIAQIESAPLGSQYSPQEGADQCDMIRSYLVELRAIIDLWSAQQ